MRTRKESELTSGTHLLETAKGLVRTRKETDRARDAYFLETTEGGLVGTRKERPGEEHSRPGDGKGNDLSGQGKKATERGALTLWKW